MSLEKAQEAELWWDRPPTRWGPGVIYLHSDVQGAPSRMHWMTRGARQWGASGGPQLDATDEDGWRVDEVAPPPPLATSAALCRMKMDGEFLESADASGPCRVAMQQSSVPKCRCPSSAKPGHASS